MYYYLTGALKRRLIAELQDSYSRHPLYRKAVPYIQNKFAFDQRPQFGIVVKGSSTNKVQFSASNFMGTVQSYVMLAHVGQPAYPIEWVREDLNTVLEGGRPPTAPGVYFIEILQVPTNPSEVGTFAVDPLITETGEALLEFQSGVEREAQLQHPPAANTLRIWENHKFLLKEGVDYSVNYDDGAVTLINRFSPGSVLVADYRWVAPSVGPVEFKWNSADITTLPGVVLAFGKRAEVGHTVAVVIYGDRVSTAEAYGGKFEASFDLDVIARDPDQMEEMADLLIMYLWGEKRSVLSAEGIEISDVGMGGESEEIYDETGDDYYYQASMSVQVQADWEIHLPLPLTFSRVTPMESEDPDAASRIVEVPDELFFATRPVLTTRNNDFERIA